MSLQPYVDMGWYTVPLKGKLERKDNGKKTDPVFEKDWKDHYYNHKNTTNTAAQLGGVMTGPRSNIIAIDCDNKSSWVTFRSLDPDYPVVFESEGKDGGTLVYSYTELVPHNFSISNGHLAMDVFSDRGFIYLPTPKNTTKKAFDTSALAHLREAPQASIDLLLSLKEPVKIHQQDSTSNRLVTNCQYHSVKHYTEKQKFDKSLFSIITPRSFRSEPEYQRHGYLHPNNVPDGRGSEYLSKVSAILGADPSIDEELYVRAMHTINLEWSQPMDQDRLDKEIVTPMLTTATIDGERIWQYDENWELSKCVIHTKRRISVEAAFDDVQQQYFVVDFTGAMDRPKAGEERQPSLHLYDNYSKMYDSISAMAVKVPNRKELQASLPLVNLVSDPRHAFGYVATGDATASTLNTFISTPALTVLQDPSHYAPVYRHPENTLRFLELLVPDNAMRQYLVEFLRYKLTTFEYSPVTLYFLGVQGSGKDVLLQFLGRIVGAHRIARPGVDEFLEKFNGWLPTAFFVQLNEYGNQLSFRNRDKAYGKLKQLTGSAEYQMRKMHSDGKQMTHNATVISTANKNAFGLEQDDRRIALFQTPNKLTDHVDSTANLINGMMEEATDFAYYLAVKVRPMSSMEYHNPPETPEKQELIADSLSPLQRLVYAVSNGMMGYLSNMAELNGAQKLYEELKRGTIYKDSLFELYSYLSMEADERALTKAIRNKGIRMTNDRTNYENRWLLDIVGSIEE